MRSLSLLHLPIECITSYQFVTRYRERTELRKERREGEGRFAKKVRLQLLFRRNANACGATRNEERRTNGGERKGRGKEPEERRPTDRHANVVLQQDNDTLPRGDNIYSSHKTAHYLRLSLHSGTPAAGLALRAWVASLSTKIMPPNQSGLTLLLYSVAHHLVCYILLNVFWKFSLAGGPIL